MPYAVDDFVILVTTSTFLLLWWTNKSYTCKIKKCTEFQSRLYINKLFEKSQSDSKTKNFKYAEFKKFNDIKVVPFKTKKFVSFSVQPEAFKEDVWLR